MHLKNDDSFDRRSVMLMLGSVVLFAANTLMIRAVALHTPAADGWVAILFREPSAWRWSTRCSAATAGWT